MPRRKQIKNLACGIACRFVSRNNDIDGYWALGILYSAAEDAGTHLLRLDLISKTASPSFKYSNRLLSQFHQYMQGQLTKSDLDGYIVGATIEVAFNVEPQPNYTRFGTTWGDPFRCCVTLLDDRGQSHHGSVVGWCGQHNSTREHRSDRRYVS
jgi:hypothetical protein